MTLWHAAVVSLALVSAGALLGVGTGKANPASAHANGVPLRHFYYVDDEPAWQSLKRNISAIGLLSPAWLSVQTNGELRVSIDARVKQLAQQHGVPLMPVIVNEEFRLEAARSAFAPARQETLIAELLKIAETEGFRGLQLDFENLETDDREPFSRFAERLGAALRKQNRSFSVAVVSTVYAPVPSNARVESWQVTPRSVAFDYERLGKASDFLTLMTYDQYTSPDAPGPVAGTGWMEACIRKLLEFVPPGKVLLGVPLYHRHWAGSQVTTGTWMDAQQISWKAKAGSLFDPVHQEPVIRFREGTVEHVIWYHNALSVQRRIELTRRFGLLGFSAWRIGQEDPSVWTEALQPAQGGTRP